MKVPGAPPSLIRHPGSLPEPAALVRLRSGHVFYFNTAMRRVLEIPDAVKDGDLNVRRFYADPKERGLLIEAVQRNRQVVRRGRFLTWEGHNIEVFGEHRILDHDVLFTRFLEEERG